MTVRNNIIANVLGRVWGALMSFAFVPLYVRFLGVEGYGLIGFFSSMLAVFFVLDVGLSVTLNRELARLGTDDEGRRAARTLVKTLESVYWAIGVVICCAVVAAAPAIASRWLNVRSLALSETVRAIQLMGLVALFRWPVALYTGALMGLQRQVVLNVIIAAMALLQGGGAVLILWLLAPTVTAFFGWQVFVALLQIVLLVFVTWRAIPLHDHRARFAVAALRSVMGFSAGITGITVLSAILTQSDKFLLSRLLPLEQFGYYSLAAAIAGLLIPAAGAVYSSVFPVYARLVANERHDELREIYHKSCQVLSVMIIPTATIVAVFASDLLTLYLHDVRIVKGVSLLLTLQIVGNCFLALMLLPVGLQFAFGWTKLSLYKNVVAVILYIPALLLAVSSYGATGAAAVWILVTLGYFLIEIQVMHRRLLRGEQWRWYFVDVGIPAVVSIALATLARFIIAPDAAPLIKLAMISATGFLAMTSSALLLQGTRALILAPIRRLYAGVRLVPNT